jgi:replicative DNA helicase
MEELDPGRTLPHSLEAERALLGALLRDPERLPEAHELLHHEDFYDRRHGILFDCLAGMVERGNPIDLVGVGEALRAQGRWEELGGADLLLGLTESVVSSASLLHHAKIVAETAALRTLVRETTQILGEAYSTRPDGDAVERLIDDAENRIFQIKRSRRGQGAEGIGDVLSQAFQRIDARSHRAGLTGVPTGYHDLDEKLSGLNGGDFVVIAARPSMGKTAFALNVVEHAAMSTPEWLGRRPSVLLFSLEMGKLSLIERMLCSRARVEGHRLRMGRLDGEDRAELTQAADDLSHTSIFIDDTPGITMMTLRSRARRVEARHGLDLIVVDYLQLLSFPRSESRQQEISSISRSLKALAREMEIPVVALAQLSRQVELRDPPRPLLSDLRESGSIEQDADVVMMLYRPEYYPKYRDDEELRGLAEVIIAKHRNGPTGTVQLQFFPNHTRFENRELGHAEPIVL